MTPEEHVEALRREGALLADAVLTADPGTRVPTCPDWTVADLARHVGRVHRAGLADVPGAGPVDDAPDDAFELAAWLTAGVRELAAALLAAPDDWPGAPTFDGGPARAFWCRRQAHETEIHRVDAQLAAIGKAHDVPRAAAADGIEELLAGFLPLPMSPFRPEQERTMTVYAEDARRTWRTVLGPAGAVTREQEGDPGDGPEVLRGPAGDLFRVLWNRPPADPWGITAEPELVWWWQDLVQIDVSKNPPRQV